MIRIVLGPLLDPGSLAPAAGAATLELASLTSHTVVLGMTGTGKTGLIVGMLEAVSEAGAPILAVDPKGDLANLAVAPDPADPSTFLPWLDPADAERRGLSLEALAREEAEAWAAALASGGVPAAALAARRAKVEVIVHTPGSEAGVPIDVLSALTRAPPGLRDDPEGLREYVTGAVSALLGLVGRHVDPLVDPGAILLARLLGDAFAAGEALPLDTLLPRVVDPPFETLGYFAVDDVIPREARVELAVALNAVAASPGFRAWLTGVPLDLAAWMAPRPDGRVPLRVVTLAHLDDRQRQFVVTLLLHAVVAWTRRLPGTTRLRALLCIDEVMGYLPPHPKDPPTKAPVLTLMKQARAVGLGVMVCTQNPVDVDYKALANAATLVSGRLQTRQDRQRVLEGLALGDDARELDDLLSRLPKRAFVARTAEGRAVFRSRQVTSWLRGPMTRREVALLGQSWSTPAEPPDGLLGEPPPQAPEVPVRWLRPEGCAALGIAVGTVWRPTLYARLRVKVAESPDEVVVHRWLRGDAVERVVLEDGWLARRRPEEPGRWHPVSEALVAAHTRRTWVAEVAATEAVAVPTGGKVRPDPDEVTVLGWALVWVPG